MKNTLPEVDTYIEGAAGFAQPILKRLRRLFHQACPEMQESIKWSSPFFEYKGIVGNMSAFKSHVSHGFWKAGNTEMAVLKALGESKKAQATFEGLSPSHRNEYVEWITEAKREATRVKRVATAVEWMAVGKPRNWKYMKEWR